MQLLSSVTIPFLSERGRRPTKDNIPVKQRWRICLSHRQSTRQNDPNRRSKYRHPSVFLHGQKPKGRLTEGET